jgi:hypothetical protein
MLGCCVLQQTVLEANMTPELNPISIVSYQEYLLLGGL